MPPARRSAAAIGAAAEALVCAALRRDGWDILATNFRGGGGELDVVALRDGLLRVVEVKARARADGSALRAITRTKRRRLTAAVEAFLARRPHLDFEEVSFSIAVLEQQRLRWVHDAFDAESLC